jgi:hypothetical protein
MSEQSNVPIASLCTWCTIERLNDDFWQLKDEQEQALQNATYVGMSAYVAKQFEERLAKIAKLCQRLAGLRSNSDTARLVRCTRHI